MLLKLVRKLFGNRPEEKAETKIMSKQEAEQESLRLVMVANFDDAARVVATFEASQPSPRGAGFTWDDSAAREMVTELRMIASVKPSILGEVTENQLHALRIGASMMSMWGTSRCAKWLPKDLPGSFRSMDVEAAARMFMFMARNAKNIENGIKIGIKSFDVLTCDDSCDACKAHAKKIFAYDEIPEIPHPGCTHPMGCRCIVMPVV